MLPNVQPLGSRVLIEQVGMFSKSPAGLYRPPSQREDPWEGKVLAAGPLAHDVKAGDRVIYGRYAGRRVSLDGKEYTIMDVDSIFGVIA